MNSKMKRRLVVVTGIIIVVVVLVLAFVGSGGAAKTLTVSQAQDSQYQGTRVEVSGTVVDNSYSTSTEGVLTFSIYDPDDESATLDVSYSGAAASTFGNGITAICTGTIDESGVLQCSELVTKCPSKYESATEALSVSSLLGYGDDIIDKTCKVTGTVKAGTLTAAGSGDRFTLTDPETGDEVAITYDGALADSITDGSSVVVTGAMNAEGKFAATDVAEEA